MMKELQALLDHWTDKANKLQAQALADWLTETEASANRQSAGHLRQCAHELKAKMIIIQHNQRRVIKTPVCVRDCSRVDLRNPYHLIDNRMATVASFVSLEEALEVAEAVNERAALCVQIGDTYTDSENGETVRVIWVSEDHVGVAYYNGNETDVPYAKFMSGFTRQETLI